MSRERLRIVAGVAIVVVAALVVGIVVWKGRDDGADCDGALADRERLMTDPITEGSRTVDVIGDSYTLGTGLAGPQVAWPADLGKTLDATVRVDGVGSTGFTTRGFCTGAEVTYGERLDDEWRDADVVVVQGGVNDALSGTPDDVEKAVADLLDELEDVGTVVVVGPPNIPSAEPGTVEAVDAGMRQATEDADRLYVSLVGAGIELVADQVHPTEAGQKRIADLVAFTLWTSGEQR